MPSKNLEGTRKYQSW